jgi:hypothetical protein
MPADVRIGLETFADGHGVDAPHHRPRAAEREQIARSPPVATRRSTTSWWASQHFTPTVEHKVLVLLSDGKDEGSTATLLDAVAAVEGLHVEAISLTTAETDLESLRRSAVTSADDADGVSAAFARVAGLVSRCWNLSRSELHRTADHHRHRRRRRSHQLRPLPPRWSRGALGTGDHGGRKPSADDVLAVAGRRRHLRRSVPPRPAALPP